MKSFFIRILGALGWHAEKPFPFRLNGQPLLETVFIRVNNGTPFPVPPSRLKGTIDYFKLVVFEKGTHEVFALTAGQMRVASEIKSAQELIASLERGHIINMVGMI